ncbi:MAG: efflux RND transporter periplasmic adaptor subunit, partial [Myxococcota bacterium]
MEHGLPESKCTKCNPTLIDDARSNGDYCEAHGFPESVCPRCNPQTPPAGVEQAVIEARVVRLRTPSLEQAVGIQVVTAELRQASTNIECTARIEFDANRIADIRAIVPGVVRQIRATLGMRVQREAPLFTLQSTRIGEIQGELVKARQRVRTARSNLSRKRKLRADNIASARQVELAERELSNATAEAKTAAAALRMAGATETMPSGQYVVAAPFAGTIVRRPAVVGLLATQSESLATLADTSMMWAICDVPAAQASRVSTGQTMAVEVEGRENERLQG